MAATNGIITVTGITHCSLTVTVDFGTYACVQIAIRETSDTTGGTTYAYFNVSDSSIQIGGAGNIDYTIKPETSYTLNAKYMEDGGTADASGWYGAVVVITLAEDEEEEIEWVGSTSTLGTSILSTVSTSVYFSDYYEIYGYKVSFKNSGTATFYTTGSIDTWGFLSTATGYNSDSGQPSSYLVTSDDNGSDSNFKISYSVTAGTTYYIWVRTYDGQTTGTTSLYVDPPWTSRGGTSSGALKASFVKEATCNTDYTLYYWHRKFKYSGKAKFYTNIENVATEGYLIKASSDMSECDNFDSATGVPTGEKVAFDSNANGSFSISCNVDAEQYYCIFIRTKDGSALGTFTLFIDPPVELTLRHYDLETFEEINKNVVITGTCGETFNLKDKATGIPGYTYSYASLSKGGTAIEDDVAILIDGAETFHLYYEIITYKITFNYYLDGKLDSSESHLFEPGEMVYLPDWCKTYTGYDFKYVSEYAYGDEYSEDNDAYYSEHEVTEDNTYSFYYTIKIFTVTVKHYYDNYANPKYTDEDSVTYGTVIVPWTAYAKEESNYELESVEDGSLNYGATEEVTITSDTTFYFYYVLGLLLWTWEDSNGAASKETTVSSGNAAAKKGATSAFSYLVWNDMCDKVAEILEAKGLTNAAATTSDYGFAVGTTLSDILAKAYMSAGDEGQKLTAERFNALNFCIIQAGGATGILVQQANLSSVLGAYFIGGSSSIVSLMDAANKIINNL